MGKFDHIPELTGPDTYFTWKREVAYSLGTEDLWCHVTDKVDLDNILGTASYQPIAVIPTAPTDAEAKSLRDWLINDLKAKAIITCHLSTSVQQLMSTSHKVLARDAWKTLEDHFGRTDIGSQHVIWQTLYALAMKDVADVPNYVGKHTVLRECLLNMGATYSDEEAIFQLLHGLPRATPWPHFKSITLSSTVSLTFDMCVAQISAEVARLIDEHALKSKHGSEYVHAAASAPANVNPITGLCEHHHNPKGLFCMTIGCSKGDHDHVHCYAKGGGMEGQAPWMKDRVKKKELIALVPPATTITAFAGCQQAADMFLADLSCASIVEIPDGDAQ